MSIQYIYTIYLQCVYIYNIMLLYVDTHIYIYTHIHIYMVDSVVVVFVCRCSNNSCLGIASHWRTSSMILMEKAV